MQVDYAYAKDTDKPKSQSVHVTVSLKGTELLSIHVFFVMMIYTLIITNHIYTYIICWFSWLIFCSCQPNHHPIFAGQGGVSFRLESSGRCSVWMQSSAFLEITVFVLVMMLKCKCYIYIYTYNMYLFLTGIGKLFNTFGENFLGQKCGLRCFFPVDLSCMYGRNDANLPDSYGHLFLESPSSNLQVLWWIPSGRVMTSQCESESPKLHQLTSIRWCRFLVLEVSFFFSSARIASRSWLTCKECWTWKQLLNSLTRLLGLYRDCSRSVEPIVVVEQIESWVCWTSLPVLYLRQGICYHVFFQSFRWLYNYMIR